MLSPPAAAQAPAKISRIGFLTSGACPGVPSPTHLKGFIDALQERGYVAGQNLAIECRHTEEGSDDRFRRLAAELVGLKVDLIFAVSSAAVRAVRTATRTVPIVALDMETDPVASGLAAGLARPGGNVTGVFLDQRELNGKWLELLREIVPQLARVAVLWDATLDPTPLRAFEGAARALGVQVHVIQLHGSKDLDNAVATAARQRADALVVMQSPITDMHHRKRVADLALRHRLPTIAMFPHFVNDGYLISYGPNIGHLFKHATSFIARILRGARPGELPIERPTHFYIAINAKTARALGLKIPPSVLGRADDVIQ